jgi:hypothetical protein
MPSSSSWTASAIFPCFRWSNLHVCKLRLRLNVDNLRNNFVIHFFVNIVVVIKVLNFRSAPKPRSLQPAHTGTTLAVC